MAVAPPQTYEEINFYETDQIKQIYEKMKGGNIIYDEETNDPRI